MLLTGLLVASLPLGMSYLRQLDYHNSTPYTATVSQAIYPTPEHPQGFGILLDGSNDMFHATHPLIKQEIPKLDGVELFGSTVPMPIAAMPANRDRESGNKFFECRKTYPYSHAPFIIKIYKDNLESNHLQDWPSDQAPQECIGCYPKDYQDSTYASQLNSQYCDDGRPRLEMPVLEDNSRFDWADYNLCRQDSED